MKLRPKKKMSGIASATTQSHHFDDVTERLIFKYLTIGYPVHRININGKFKRCVIIDDVRYSLSEDKGKFINHTLNNYDYQRANGDPNASDL